MLLSHNDLWNSRYFSAQVYNNGEEEIGLRPLKGCVNPGTFGTNGTGISVEIDNKIPLMLLPLVKFSLENNQLKRYPNKEALKIECNMSIQ